MKNIHSHFQGWHLISDSTHVARIPWGIMISLFLSQLLYMAVCTALSKADSPTEKLLEGTKVHHYFESTLWKVVSALSIAGTLSRALVLSPIDDLGTMVVAIIAFASIVMIMLEKVPAKWMPYVYGIVIVMIAALPSWYQMTPVFIVPTLLGILTGALVGIVDAQKFGLIERTIRRW